MNKRLWLSALVQSQPPNLALVDVAILVELNSDLVDWINRRLRFFSGLEALEDPWMHEVTYRLPNSSARVGFTDWSAVTDNWDIQDILGEKADCPAMDFSGSALNFHPEFPRKFLTDGIDKRIVGYGIDSEFKWFEVYLKIGPMQTTEFSIKLVSEPVLYMSSVFIDRYDWEAIHTRCINKEN